MSNFEPTYINIEFFYLKAYEFLKAFGLSPEDFKVPFAVKLVLVVVSIALASFIIYVVVKLSRLRRYELGRLLETVDHRKADKEVRSEDWERLQALLDSDSEADWRHAILEADKMLDQMTIRMGLVGENLGERLKNVEPSDFTNLQSAWEAHKIRNRIAHEQGFILTKREARRGMALFEQALREFGSI